MTAETSTALVPKLTKDQYNMLLYFEQYYWKRSALPSYEMLVRDGIELDEATYYETWNNLRFIDGLRGRGIPEHMLTHSGGRFNGKLLTEQQITVANIMLDVLDKRSRLKKLTELGVTTAEYNGWLRDPLYRSYCLARAEELLGENQHVAHLSLIDRVSQGDLGAIKYFNSLTGRYREKQSAAVEINNVSLNNYGSDTVIQIVEIIQRHVKDPELLQLIAGDILALQGETASNSVHTSNATVQALPVGLGEPPYVHGEVFNV